MSLHTLAQHLAQVATSLAVSMLASVRTGVQSSDEAEVFLADSSQTEMADSSSQAFR